MHTIIYIIEFGHSTVVNRLELGIHFNTNNIIIRLGHYCTW